MERAVAAEESLTSPFLRWEEMYVTGENERKEVRYYLERRDGTLDLVVVGKEKKLGHISYQFVNREESNLNLKLRSRKDVVDWLNSIVTGIHTPPHAVGVPSDLCKLDLETPMDVEQPKLGKYVTEFSWVGSTWTCRKKRKHYQSYKRIGVSISVHDFVYVLAEEGKRLVAYLEDMYEDTKGNKMVVVQWFHKVDEVGIALPHNYNNREVFFSLCLQHLSIECVDGLAAVLSPQHFETFMNVASYTKYEPFVCHRQFDNDDVKPFDITQVKGYWKQEILGFISAFSRSKAYSKSRPSSDRIKEGTSGTDAVGIRPKKRLRRSKDGDLNNSPSVRGEGGNDVNLEMACPTGDSFIQKDFYNLAIGSKIEVLSQDSGVRGCWFRGLIIKKHKDKVKVQYQDVKDAADESINLEEWILATKVAVPDQLGIRISGRTTVRPASSAEKGNFPGITVGSVVDAWWHDGWWEGVVVQKDSDEKIHVYLPGENQKSVFCLSDMRQSDEWLGNEWKQLKRRPEIASSLRPSQVVKSGNSKLSDIQHDQSATNESKGLETVNKDSTLKSIVGNCNSIKDSAAVIKDLSKDALLAQLKWNGSRKRRRGRDYSRKPNCSVNKKKKNGLKLLDTKSCENFFLRQSLKVVDHDNCKFIRDSSVVPPLTSLVMSQCY